MTFTQIKALANRALADGILTQAEMDDVHDAILFDGLVSAEEASLLDDIYNKLFWGQIQIGV